MASAEFEAMLARVKSIGFRVGMTRADHRAAMLDLGRALWEWKSASTRNDYGSLVRAAGLNMKTAQRAVKLFEEIEGGVKAAAKPLRVAGGGWSESPRNVERGDKRAVDAPKSGSAVELDRSKLTPEQIDALELGMCAADVLAMGMPRSDADDDLTDEEMDPLEELGGEQDGGEDEDPEAEFDDDEDDAEVSLPSAGSDRAARPVIASPRGTQLSLEQEYLAAERDLAAWLNGVRGQDPAALERWRRVREMEATSVHSF